MKQTADFQITGMTCAACASRIEKGLARLPGVQSASVNFAMETAHVVYAGASEKEVVEKVQALGYGAVPEISQEEHDRIRSRETASQKIKFFASAALSLPLFYTMAGHFSFLSFLPVPALFMNPWFQFLLATPVQFAAGWQFYYGSFKALRDRSANMDVLVATGTTAAYVYSLWNSLSGRPHTELYYETGAVLITLILLGKLLESAAKNRTSQAIRSLISLAPGTAIRIKDGKEEEIAVDRVVPGDQLRIRPGEKIPVDGEILEGNLYIDESMITGESMPAEKSAGASIFAATINGNTGGVMTARKVGKDTVLSRIIKVVREAQTSRAPIQRIADRISGVFAPVVMGIALLTFTFWYLITGDFSASLRSAIAVLVIACPCALGLAVPTSIMAGSGRGAESGILFKSGEFLETAGKIDFVVFDKTGTVTSGRPELAAIEPSSDFDPSLLPGAMAAVLAAEKGSEHPAARAIEAGLASYIADSAESGSVVSGNGMHLDSFEAMPGRGIRAVVEGKSVIVGTQILQDESGISTLSLRDVYLAEQSKGRTAVYVSVDGKAAAVLAVADMIRPSSRLAVERLKALGIGVAMITGDNETTAKNIAASAGIEQVFAGVMPDQKARIIREIQETGRKIAMVGDGINDAPALASADLGIAVGGGSDIALETGGVTILGGDINRAVDAILLGRRTLKNIRQNLFWALFYNALGIPVAAAGLLEPWIAGAAMAFSSLSVVLNALRLQRAKLL